MSYYEYGYGFDLSELHLDRPIALVKEAGDYEDFLSDYEGTKKNKDLECTEEEYCQVWLNEWEETSGEYGLAVYLRNMINYKEGWELEAYPEGTILYVPERTPWEFNEKMKNLTPEVFQETVLNYIKIFSDDVPCYKYHTMYHD